MYYLGPIWTLSVEYELFSRDIPTTTTTSWYYQYFLCAFFFLLFFIFFKKHILVNVVVVLQSVNSIALFSLHRKMHHSALAHLLPKCTEMKRHPNSL